VKLTKVQRKMLLGWHHTHEYGMSLAFFLRKALTSWALLALPAAAAYFIIVPNLPGLGWTVVGLCIGAALRDIGYYRIGLDFWPIRDQIVDWQRVTELLDADAG